MRSEPDEGVVDAALSDDEVARLWASSGAAWLTDSESSVPSDLVRRIVGLTHDLDRRGAGFGHMVGSKGLGTLAERAASMGLPPAGPVSAGGATRVVPTIDGWIALSLARTEDREAIAAWLECDPPGDLDDGPWDRIEEAVRSRPAEELRDRAVLLGLPLAVVGETIDDRPVIAERLGECRGRAVADALVVNLSALWAGPLCADVLGRVGARVITVESSKRPDGGRQAPRFFAALHGRTESVALDLTTAGGQRQLRDLVRCADIVIEGSRPRALEQMGIDSVAMVAGAGPSVWVSITAHGRHAEAANRVGFGDDAAAAGGLMRWADGRPHFVADAVADPLTGLTAAVSASELFERDGRFLIDVSLARTSRSVSSTWTELPVGLDIARPRPRADPGRRLPLGRHTGQVLAEFDIA